MNGSQISLILIVIFVIYCVFFWKKESFKSKENFGENEITDVEGQDAPIYSPKCCGNLFNMTPEHNDDPNFNVTYFPSNINHLGDGDSPQGCRCLTVKEINFLSSIQFVIMWTRQIKS